jgi:hypothetical protein
MFIYEKLLFLLTFLVIIGTPTYIFYRLQMVRPKSPQRFSKRRVLKVTLLNLSMNVTMYVYFLILLLSILFKQASYSRPVIGVALSSLVVLGLSLYGSGIYVASITHKAFTLPELKSLKSFQTQHLATHIFHGPISHVLIFTGYTFALALLSVLDIFSGRGTAQLVPWLFGCGIILGIFFGISQIFNGSIPYQFITALFAFALLLMYSNLTEHRLLEYSVATYYVGFSLSFLVSAVIYYFYRGRHKENIWDLSGH